MMDWFLYSGALERGDDLNFIEFVASEKKSDELSLILCTPGGSPDAAYKIGRYLQSRYSNVRVIIPGFCKSAGTLLAIAANEIVFSPYGELGPLDIQMAKADNLAGLESGLNISEAFLTLEKRAKDTFHDLLIEITNNSGGVVSFQTASHSAAEIVASLFGPIFGGIDPEEVGSRARAMRIGEDYGIRLNQHFSNLKPTALSMLSQSYPSHGFVIDMLEAQKLFHRVAETTDAEKKLFEAVGLCCRIPERKLRFSNLLDTNQNDIPQKAAKDEQQHKKNGTGAAPKRTTKGRAPRKRPVNGEDSSSAGAT